MGQTLWTGKLPAYWFIATWALLTDTYASVIFRDKDTNRRKLRVVPVDQNSPQEINTTYNVLIGVVNKRLLLTRVDDGRSHDQLSYFGWLNLDSLQFEWELRRSALIEKFSIPYTLDQNSLTYSCGLLHIDLDNGQSSILSEPSPLVGVWPLGDNITLQSIGKKGLTAYQNGNLLWHHSDYLGTHYQCIVENQLYFLLPTNEFVCIDKRSGNKLWQIHLTHLSNEGRTKGRFEAYNDTSSRNSFIANLLINQNLIVWTTDGDTFMAYDRLTGNVSERNRHPNEFLVDLNNDQVMTLLVDEEIGTGTLTLTKLEEFFNEHC